MINICPKCYAVTFNNDGWRYANKFNSTRFCIDCGVAMSVYKDNDLYDFEIQRYKELHERYTKK